MRLPLVSVVAFSALALSIGALFATPASAAPFFSLDGGTPYTLGSLKGWEDATLKLSAPGIVTFTDLGETSHDKVIFDVLPNGPPVTTYSDPRFISIIFGGAGGFIRFYDFLLDINNAVFFTFSQPDVWPYDTYANDVGPQSGSNAAVFLDSITGERQRDHLTSVILDFDDGSHGVGDDGRTFGDMRWMISVDQVPEPGSLVMLLTALGGLGWLRRPRSNRQMAAIAPVAASLALFALAATPDIAHADAIITFDGTVGTGSLSSGSARTDLAGMTISGQLYLHADLAGSFPVGVGGVGGPGFLSPTIMVDGRSFTFLSDSFARLSLTDNFPGTASTIDHYDIIDVGAHSTTSDGVRFDAWASADVVHGRSLDQVIDIGPTTPFFSELTNSFTYTDSGTSVTLEFALRDVHMHPVAEPGSLLMLVTALGGLVWLTRRDWSKRMPRIALGVACAALLGGATTLATPASATMLITLDAPAYSNGTSAPISMQITFDPQLGTVFTGKIGSQYTGPMSATVDYLGQSYSFAGDGRVQLKDNFPENPLNNGSNTDFNDFISVALQVTVPTGPNSTHTDFIHFLDESFSEDFIQGLSFTQSFAHHGGDTEYTDVFIDHSAVGGVVEPGSLEADIDLWHADISMHPVPEPGSLVMLLTALGALSLTSRRRRH